MKEIVTSKGEKIKVDDDDFDLLNNYTWRVSPQGYAITTVGKVNARRDIRMHRLVNQTPNGKLTDHKNHDKLDNQKSNLRTCSASQNSANRKAQRGSKSGLKGVSWVKNCNKWEARITANKQSIRLGMFIHPEDAAKAYKDAAVELFGEYAYA